MTTDDQTDTAPEPIPAATGLHLVPPEPIKDIGEIPSPPEIPTPPLGQPPHPMAPTKADLRRATAEAMQAAQAKERLLREWNEAPQWAHRMATIMDQANAQWSARTADLNARLETLESLNLPKILAAHALTIKASCQMGTAHDAVLSHLAAQAGINDEQAAVIIKAHREEIAKLIELRNAADELAAAKAKAEQEIKDHPCTTPLGIHVWREDGGYITQDEKTISRHYTCEVCNNAKIEDRPAEKAEMVTEPASIETPIVPERTPPTGPLPELLN